MSSLGALPPAVLQGTGAPQLSVQCQRHRSAARQRTDRLTADRRATAVRRPASGYGCCSSCGWQSSRQSCGSVLGQCAACSAAVAALGSTDAWKQHRTPQVRRTLCSVLGVDAFYRYRQKLGIKDNAEVLCCVQVQRQLSDGAFHALQVRCAAAGRDGDAAEPDQLQQAQDSRPRQLSQRPPPEREPYSTQQAVQQAPPPAGNGQHGGTLSNAEKQQAMAAALQLFRSDQIKTANGHHVSNGSSAQPPAASVPAASNGAESRKRAALALLQQHSPPNTGRESPAATPLHSAGQPGAGHMMTNGAHPAGPPAPKAPPAAGPAAPNGVRPPGQQRAVAAPAQPGKAAPPDPLDTKSPTAPAEGRTHGPQLPTEPPLPRQQRPPKLPEFRVPPPVAPPQPTAPQAPVVEQ
jgi:hypothetical protein